MTSRFEPPITDQYLLPHWNWFRHFCLGAVVYCRCSTVSDLQVSLAVMLEWETLKHILRHQRLTTWLLLRFSDLLALCSVHKHSRIRNWRQHNKLHAYCTLMNAMHYSYACQDRSCTRAHLQFSVYRAQYIGVVDSQILPQFCKCQCLLLCGKWLGPAVKDTVTSLISNTFPLSAAVCEGK